MASPNKKPFDGVCRICGATDIPGAPGYSGLKDHVLKNRKTHQKAVYWAKHYDAKRMERHITKIERSRGKDKPPPATPEQKKAKKDAAQTLSRVNQYADTYCFSGNHIVNGRELPIEFINSADAWRINGKLVVNCTIHSSVKKETHAGK
jgi:hypothetical protein